MFIALPLIIVPLYAATSHVYLVTCISSISIHEEAPVVHWNNRFPNHNVPVQSNAIALPVFAGSDIMTDASDFTCIAPLLLYFHVTLNVSQAVDTVVILNVVKFPTLL
jgi:hypothetical protein